MKKNNTLSTQKLASKAAIYTRVSTEEQAKQGFSLAAQEDALKNYAQATGYELFKIYKDEGKSAKDIKHRPALKQLLKDAEDKKFNAIFVYKLDRFSRSLKDLILTIEKLKEWEVDFISLQDKIETASASGKLMFHIISAFAEFERDIISERTIFGMTEKAKEGKAITKAPRGYKLINGQLTIDEENKKVIEQIFNIFINTNLSLTQIAKQNGLTTRGLIKLLKNRTYLGEIKFKENYKGEHQSIISEEIFKKAQDKLENISFNTALQKNYNLTNKILVQGDSRYFDPYYMDIVAYFITKGAINVEENAIPPIQEPKEKETKKIAEPQKFAKYMAYVLLKNEGFSDSEIFFERYFGSNKPDVGVINNEKSIFIECFSCRVSKVIDYLAQDRELWVLTNGAFPWDKNPLFDYMRLFIFKKGPNWDSIFKEYENKKKEILKKVKSPLDSL
ncbi:recombinase family protein [Candidatus Woesearchaeota archaeon]|nr:recombinase family protein [Candidatus Woesearchaeota archaeon]